MEHIYFRVVVKYYTKKLVVKKLQNRLQKNRIEYRPSKSHVRSETHIPVIIQNIEAANERRSHC